MSARKILITCEHADNIVPKAYQHLFTDAKNDLFSHKGYDDGSYDLAKYLARELHVGMYYQKVSRLLIEMNRSLDANDLFSNYSQFITESEKKELINKYYKPYRTEVEQKIADTIKNGDAILHLSIHTFTPSLNGVERLVDIGVLCDEEKSMELSFSKMWKDKLAEAIPNKLVMINMPYNGADDGFTTYLRTKFKQDGYLGIELEVNQKYINSEDWVIIKKSVLQSLK